jgi:hypothetical protein
MKWHLLLKPRKKKRVVESLNPILTKKRCTAIASTYKGNAKAKFWKKHPKLMTENKVKMAKRSIQKRRCKDFHCSSSS